MVLDKINTSLLVMRKYTLLYYIVGNIIYNILYIVGGLFVEIYSIRVFLCACFISTYWMLYGLHCGRQVHCCRQGQQGGQDQRGG